MDIALVTKLLVLLSVANGAPVMAKKLLRRRFDAPVDLGIRLPDGNPLLGRSKTWRGLVCSTVATGIAAVPLGFEFYVGLLFSLFSMAGDLLSSFLKRRRGMQSSSMFLGVDQIPEALLPLIALDSTLSLSVVEIVLIVALFFVGELLVSRLLYTLNLRDRPY